jgi:hypothetical protein
MSPMIGRSHWWQGAKVAVAGLLTACVLLAGCSTPLREQPQTQPPAPAPVESVESSISARAAAGLSAGYLVDSVGDDGRFVYLVNMNPEVEVPEQYNILRHGGTIYSMGQYYQLEPDDEVLSAMMRAGRYLQAEAVKPVPGEDDMLAVWSDPLEERKRPVQAKLGGAGLGLVALLSIEEAQPGFTPLDDLRGIGRFIAYLQKDDGSYYSKYIPSEGGRWDEWESLYYPGEAALGLVMLHELDPSDEWLVPAAKTLEYLARTREGQTDVPADHWALLATEKLLDLEDGEALPVSRELLTDHAIQIADKILSTQIISPARPEVDGGFARNGGTTATATRLEGLQAVLAFLPADHEARPRIQIAVDRGIAFLLRTQVTEGEFAGAFPRTLVRRDEDAEDAEEFNETATEVRVDYVQHALSALVRNVWLTEGVE